MTATRSARLRDAAVLVGLLALAAALRLPGLAARGTFDSDQGTDALVVRNLVRDGVVPLLGPQTSIGDFHHGALYYYLIAPAGIPSGGDDPIALVALIAILGVAAVGVTWWLARAIAGPGAALVAGLVLAVSASAVDGSTFLWNPNPIPFFAAVALATAWLGASSGRTRWWLVAGAAQAIVGQLHVLGILGLVPLGALWLWAVRRSPGRRRALIGACVGVMGIVALGYVPLLVYELGNDFPETRGALAWLAGTGRPAEGGPGFLDRLLFVPLRILSFPLSGLVTRAPVAAVLSVTTWVAIVAIGALRARGEQRLALAWLGGWAALGAILLAIVVPSLGTVNPLPADHYHAFLWPAIAVAAGVATAILWRDPASAEPADAEAADAQPADAQPGNAPDGRRRVAGRAAGSAGGRVGGPAARSLGGRVAGRAILVGVVAATVAWNLGSQPPAAAADGGWSAAEAAARRVATATDGRSPALLGVPHFKGTGAMAYPLAVIGAPAVEPGRASDVVVLCDAVFEEVVGLSCGGAAEAARLADAGITPGPLLDRFLAAPDRWVSVYGIAGR